MTTSIDAPGCNWDNGLERINTPPKTNMDTQNDRLEKVTSFKNGHFGIYVI